MHDVSLNDPIICSISPIKSIRDAPISAMRFSKQTVLCFIW